MEIHEVSLDRLIPYARNARKNDRAVPQMVASIREFGFKIPLLARHRGEEIEIVDGHLRVKGALKMGMAAVPVIYCDEWSEAQVKAFRLMVNRSATWADWDEDLVALEIGDLKALDYDLNLTGFDTKEIDEFLFRKPEESVDVIPDAPECPISRLGDLWLCGEHRVLCGDATSAEAVARLLGERKPLLMVTDPPFGIGLHTDWRDDAGLNGRENAKPGVATTRTVGHTATSISGDTRADWSDAFGLVPSLEAAYVFHASKFTREVLDGLLRIGFLHHQQLIWNKGRAVLTRTPYWFAHEPIWFVRKKNAPWFGKPGENSTVWDSPSPKFFMGGSHEEKFDHPNQKPVELMRRPILNHTRRGEFVYEPFLGSGTVLAAAEMVERICLGLELDPKFMDVVVRRWQQLTGKGAVLDNDGRSFEDVSQERMAAREVPACPDRP